MRQWDECGAAYVAMPFNVSRLFVCFGCIEPHHICSHSIQSPQFHPKSTTVFTTDVALQRTHTPMTHMQTSVPCFCPHATDRTPTHFEVARRGPHLATCHRRMGSSNKLAQQILRTGCWPAMPSHTLHAEQLGRHRTSYGDAASCSNRIRLQK